MLLDERIAQSGRMTRAGQRLDLRGRDAGLAILFVALVSLAVLAANRMERGAGRD
jgi:hypothetical protein